MPLQATALRLSFLAVSPPPADAILHHHVMPLPTRQWTAIRQGGAATSEMAHAEGALPHRDASTWPRCFSSHLRLIRGKTRIQEEVSPGKKRLMGNESERKSLFPTVFVIISLVSPFPTPFAGHTSRRKSISNTRSVGMMRPLSGKSQIKKKQCLKVRFEQFRVNCPLISNFSLLTIKNVIVFEESHLPIIFFSEIQIFWSFSRCLVISVRICGYGLFKWAGLQGGRCDSQSFAESRFQGSS